MKERFEKETAGLMRSWMQHDRGFLRDYLVADVEDPRINLQSILTRHFLIERLTDGRWAALREQELRFGMVMNWLLKLAKGSPDAEQRHLVLDALMDGEAEMDGRPIPAYVTETFASLPAQANGLTAPDYITGGLIRAVGQTSQALLPEDILASFENLWQQALSGPANGHLAVLETGCGSANDYRFLDAFGLASRIDYLGLDLCEKNIANAQAMFKQVRFEVGNVLDISTADKSFDVSFAHDLFEHLSIEAMEAAIAELCRVTRQSICIGFFNMSESPEHGVNPTDDYHWNNLSKNRTKELFERCGGKVEAIHIGLLLQSRFGCTDTHNEGAYTFIVTM